ncbi:MAG TPA: deoxyuridine 5'-triphosphate nucleotidohydrolase [Thermomicrobiales bacterium]|nr:deoxyuridine 5'-triphosphate nucleotidohydrolase [Thermomicrobiales bacterium]
MASQSSTSDEIHAAYQEQAAGGALTREDLRQRILGTPPLLTDYRDLDVQLQPNGFDLTLGALNEFRGRGSIAVDNTNRVLPDLEPLPFAGDGWADLAPGIYQVLFNEIVQLPLDLMALGRPRSSLGRCGVTIHTAVWDAGYAGRSTALLSVLNPNGFRVQRNARVLQLVFYTVTRPPKSGYDGIYQGENINR